MIPFGGNLNFLAKLRERTEPTCSVPNSQEQVLR